MLNNETDPILPTQDDTNSTPAAQRDAATTGSQPTDTAAVAAPPPAAGDDGVWDRVWNANAGQREQARKAAVQNAAISALPYSRGFGDYFNDTLLGVAAGGEGLAKSVGRLGNDLTGHWFTDDDSTFDPQLRPQTVLGGMSKGVTQFTLAALPIGWAGRASGLASFASSSRGAKLLYAAGKAGLSDFVAFNGAEGRLSDLLTQYPSLNNPITRFLSTNPDDPWALARLKNSLEGLGLMGLTHGIGKAFGGVLDGLHAKVWGDDEGAKEALQAVAEQLGTEDPNLIATVRNSQEAPRVRDQILSYAKGVTPQQADHFLTLWAAVARNIGADFDEYLKKVDVRAGASRGLEGILDSGNVLAQGGEGSIPLADRGNGVEPLPVAENTSASKPPQIPLAETDNTTEPVPLAQPKAPQIPLAEPVPPSTEPLDVSSAPKAGQLPLADTATPAEPVELAEPGSINTEGGETESRQWQPPNAEPSLANVTAKGDAAASTAEAKPAYNGITEFVNDTRAILYLYQNANFSTLLHEGFHIWRRFGMNTGSLDALEQALGVENGRWTVDAEEQAARLFERYFYDGQAPSSAVAPIFQRAKQWMSAIYRTLTQSPITQDVNPDVRQAFDRMLGDSPEPYKPPVLGPQLEANGLAPASADVLAQRAYGTPASAALQVGTQGVELPEDVQRQVIDSLQQRIKDGLPLDQALTDAVRTHINFARLDVTSDTEQLLRWGQSVLDPVIDKGVGAVRSLERVKANALDELRYAGASAEQAVNFVDSLAKDAEFMKQMDSRLVSARMLRNTLAQDIYGLVQQVRSAGTEAEQQGLTNDLMQRVGLFNKLNYATQVIQTEGARIPGAGRVAAGYANGIDVEGMTNAIRNELASGSFESKRLLSIMEAASGGDDPQALRNVLSTYEEAGRTIARKTLSVHNELWINQLLNSPVGWATKAISDTANTILAPAERMLGGALMSAMGGPGGGQAVRQAYNVYASLLGQFADFFQLNRQAMFATEDNAFSNAAKVLTSETPTIDAHPFDSRAISSANLGLDPKGTLGQAVDWAGYVIRTPSRVYSSADELFKGFNYRAALRADGIEKAMQRGLSGDDFAAFVSDYIDQGFDSAGKGTNDAAMQYARAATFSSDLEGGLGKLVQDGVNKYPFLKLVVPFVKVPTNIFRRFVQYTPGLNLLSEDFRSALTGSDPYAKASALGRLAVGTAFWSAVVGLAAGGNITGNGPSNPEARQALMDSGWRPKSLVLTKDDGAKEYVSYERMEPWAMVLGLAADFHEASAQMADDDAHAVGSAMVSAIAKNLTSKSYFTGLTEFLNAMQDPDKFGTAWLKQRAASYVAPIFGQFSDDPYLRDTRTVMDAVLRKLPGYSQDLAPKRDALGEPIMRDQPTWSPFRTAEESDDPVRQNLAALEQGLPKVQRKYAGLDLAAFKNDQGQDAYDRLQQLTGQVQVNGKSLHDSLGRLFASDWWQQQLAQDTANGRQPSMTDPSVMAVHRTFSQFHQAARQQMLKEYPDVGEMLNAVRVAQRRATNPNIQAVLNYGN